MPTEASSGGIPNGPMSRSACRGMNQGLELVAPTRYRLKVISQRKLDRAHVLVSISRVAREAGVETDSVRAAIRRARLQTVSVETFDQRIVSGITLESASAYFGWDEARAAALAAELTRPESWFTRGGVSYAGDLALHAPTSGPEHDRMVPIEYLDELVARRCCEVVSCLLETLFPTMKFQTDASTTGAVRVRQGNKIIAEIVPKELAGMIRARESGKLN